MTVKTAIHARDVMASEPVCVERSTTIEELARVLAEHEISGAPVVDQGGRLVGVVSRTDLIRRCAEGTLEMPPAFLFELMAEHGGADADLQHEAPICVEDFMTTDPVTATPTTPARELARTMHEGRIHRVIVVDDDRCPVGIVTSLDMLGALAS